MKPIPTLQNLVNDLVADIEASWSDTLPEAAKSFLRALAGVFGGKLYLYYLQLASVQKNIFPDTADSEANGGTLERFGRVKLNRSPFPARAGQYTVTVTGTIGSTIPANTTFKSNDDSLNPGKLFILDAAYTTTANPDTITVRALEAGTTAKLSIADQLTSTTPLLGLSSIVTVATEAVQPLAAETTEEYRQKTIDAYRLEPQGGAATDYRLWSYDAQGVKEAYPYAKSGAPNEINVFVEATIADSTDGHGTPSQQILDDVAEVIEFDPDTTRPAHERGRRPLGVFQVHVLPVQPLAVEIVIPNLQNRTAAIEDAIETALLTEINNVRPFIAACDILSEKNDILDVNKIVATILGVFPGASFAAPQLTVGGSPSSTYTFINGNIPYLNTVTFT